ncbi:hypothetical protein MRX96_033840 [Rhipicephalus microplus]
MPAYLPRGPSSRRRVAEAPAYICGRMVDGRKKKDTRVGERGEGLALPASTKSWDDDDGVYTNGISWSGGTGLVTCNYAFGLLSTPLLPPCIVYPPPSSQAMNSLVDLTALWLRAQHRRNAQTPQSLPELSLAPRG